MKLKNKMGRIKRQNNYIQYISLKVEPDLAKLKLLRN